MYRDDRYLSESRSGNSAPLWLVSFTDVMALMLTFFVMLYAMAVPEKVAWEDAKKAMAIGLAKGSADKWSAGTIDDVGISTVSVPHALDLKYLNALLEKKIRSEKSLSNIRLISQSDRLIISFPSELLFAPTNINVSDEGKRALWSLASLLNRIDNKIVLVGHADPRPVEALDSAYKNNRALSLARALSVANFMSQSGYDRALTVYGAGSARFAQIGQSVRLEDKLPLSRRVDIVIMSNSRV